MPVRSFIVLFLFFFQSGFAEQNPDNSDLGSFFSSKAIAFDHSGDLDQLIEIAGQRQLVLLGEASHGTHEYYRWRAEISKRLITEYGFTFIAVEGDWASIYRLNKYVKGLDHALSSAKEVVQTFKRWPEWMWANTDILELADWLKRYNEALPPEERVGFYGIDVYGQWEAMEDLLSYSRESLPGQYDNIAQKLNCFAGFGSDEWQYARAVAGGHESCEEELQGVVEIIRGHKESITNDEEMAWFRAKQNALVVRNAESYYRLAMQRNHEAWNSRVDHFWLTVERLLSYYGEDAKGVVWAHNTHVGDSRATSMAMQNQYNIGALSRTRLGEENVFIIGFGTQQGKVNAGRQWGSPMQVMNVPRAQKGSLDDYLGKVPHKQFFLLFDQQDRDHTLLTQPLGHRAIGVVYDPHREEGNYVPTLPAHRYDALIFFQKTSALTPVE